MARVAQTTTLLWPLLGIQRTTPSPARPDRPRPSLNAPSLIFRRSDEIARSPTSAAPTVVFVEGNSTSMP